MKLYSTYRHILSLSGYCVRKTSPQQRNARNPSRQAIELVHSFEGINRHRAYPPSSRHRHDPQSFEAPRRSQHETHHDSSNVNISYSQRKTLQFVSKIVPRIKFNHGEYRNCQQHRCLLHPRSSFQKPQLRQTCLRTHRLSQRSPRSLGNNETCVRIPSFSLPSLSHPLIAPLHSISCSPSSNTNPTRTTGLSATDP